jgi:hypothetical protein
MKISTVAPLLLLAGCMQAPVEKQQSPDIIAEAEQASADAQ